MCFRDNFSANFKLTDRSVSILSPPADKLAPRTGSLAIMPASAEQPSSGRRSDSRDRLLEAALILFLERGFAATRVDDIAHRAAVSKGCVYLYFRTKQEIFEAVVDDAIVARIARAEQFAADFEGSVSELLEAVLTNNLLEFWGSASSGIPKLILAECQQFPELAASVLDLFDLMVHPFV